MLRSCMQIGRVVLLGVVAEHLGRRLVPSLASGAGRRGRTTGTDGYMVAHGGFYFRFWTLASPKHRTCATRTKLLGSCKKTGVPPWLRVFDKKTVNACSYSVGQTRNAHVVARQGSGRAWACTGVRRRARACALLTYLICNI